MHQDHLLKNFLLLCDFHRTGSMDRRPVVGGNQKRLPSIEQENNWNDEQARRHLGLQRSSSTENSSGEISPSSHTSNR